MRNIGILVEIAIVVMGIAISIIGLIMQQPAIYGWGVGIAFGVAITTFIERESMKRQQHKQRMEDIKKMRER